jgi:hypothetical protein
VKWIFEGKPGVSGIFLRIFRVKKTARGKLFSIPQPKLGPRVGRAGGKTGKTFGIPCRAYRKIAEADSTSVFSGFSRREFPPALPEHAVLWVKFNPQPGWFWLFSGVG